MQLPLWAPDSSWRPPSMSDLPDWSGARRICIDCETRDDHLRELGPGVRRGGYMTGISFAIEDGPSHYLPIRHEGGDNLPEQQVLAYLREQGARFKGELVGANMSYDLDYLWEADVEFPAVEYYRDVQIADPLIYELHNSYSLDNILKRHGLPLKDEALLREAANVYGVDPKRGMWRLPARYVGAYAEADVTLPLLALRRQERLIEEENLWDIFNLESQVLPVLVRMRRRGVRIDQDRLQQVEEWSLTQEAEALQRVYNDTGVRIAVGDVWKPEAIAQAIHSIGINTFTTPTGKVSVTKEFLDNIDHPVAKSLHWARKVNKLRTTFAASVRRYMVNGRIHCTFNQIARETEAGDQKGARYGRLSSIDPNLQQQPSRDEFASMWRSIYLPEEGALWACDDYSQQEPRWTTHFAAVMNLEGAQEAARAYREDPTLDNHDFMTKLVYQIKKDDDPELFEKRRKHAKCIYLGLCYGEGGGKLCDDLGLPTRWALATKDGRVRNVEYFEEQGEALDARREHGNGFVWRAAGEEGQEILDTFDSRAPFIRKLAKRAENRVKERGYIITGGGRKLRFPQRQDGSYEWAHKGLNRLIQGTSADQMKRAMVEIDRAGHHMMLQVHDETDSSVADRAEAEQIAEIMSASMEAEVPFKVDVEVGPSWGEVE